MPPIYTPARFPGPHPVQGMTNHHQRRAPSPFVYTTPLPRGHIQYLARAEGDDASSYVTRPRYRPPLPVQFPHNSFGYTNGHDDASFVTTRQPPRAAHPQPLPAPQLGRTPASASANRFYTPANRTDARSSYAPALPSRTNNQDGDDSSSFTTSHNTDVAIATTSTSGFRYGAPSDGSGTGNGNLDFTFVATDDNDAPRVFAQNYICQSTGQNACLHLINSARSRHASNPAKKYRTGASYACRCQVDRLQARLEGNTTNRIKVTDSLLVEHYGDTQVIAFRLEEHQVLPPEPDGTTRRLYKVAFRKQSFETSQLHFVKAITRDSPPGADLPDLVKRELQSVVNAASSGPFPEAPEVIFSTFIRTSESASEALAQWTRNAVGGARNSLHQPYLNALYNYIESLIQVRHQQWETDARIQHPQLLDGANQNELNTVLHLRQFIETKSYRKYVADRACHYPTEQGSLQGFIEHFHFSATNQLLTIPIIAEDVVVGAAEGTHQPDRINSTLILTCPAYLWALSTYVSSPVYSNLRSFLADGQYSLFQTAGGTGRPSLIHFGFQLPDVHSDNPNTVTRGFCPTLHILVPSENKDSFRASLRALGRAVKDLFGEPFLSSGPLLNSFVSDGSMALQGTIHQEFPNAAVARDWEHIRRSPLKSDLWKRKMNEKKNAFLISADLSHLHHARGKDNADNAALLFRQKWHDIRGEPQIAEHVTGKPGDVPDPKPISFHYDIMGVIGCMPSTQPVERYNLGTTGGKKHGHSIRPVLNRNLGLPRFLQESCPALLKDGCDILAKKSLNETSQALRNMEPRTEVLALVLMMGEADIFTMYPDRQEEEYLVNPPPRFGQEITHDTVLQYKAARAPNYNTTAYQASFVSFTALASYCHVLPKSVLLVSHPRLVTHLKDVNNTHYVCLCYNFWRYYQCSGSMYLSHRAGLLVPAMKTLLQRPYTRRSHGMLSQRQPSRRTQNPPPRQPVSHPLTAALGLPSNTDDPRLAFLWHLQRQALRSVLIERKVKLASERFPANAQAGGGNAGQAAPLGTLRSQSNVDKLLYAIAGTCLARELLDKASALHSIHNRWPLINTYRENPRRGIVFEADLALQQAALTMAETGDAYGPIFDPFPEGIDPVDADSCHAIFIPNNDWEQYWRHEVSIHGFALAMRYVVLDGATAAAGGVRVISQSGLQSTAFNQLVANFFSSQAIESQTLDVLVHALEEKFMDGGVVSVPATYTLPNPVDDGIDIYKAAVHTKLAMFTLTLYEMGRPRLTDQEEVIIPLVAGVVKLGMKNLLVFQMARLPHNGDGDIAQYHVFDLYQRNHYHGPTSKKRGVRCLVTGREALDRLLKRFVETYITAERPFVRQEFRTWIYKKEETQHNNPEILTDIYCLDGLMANDDSWLGVDVSDVLDDNMRFYGLIDEEQVNPHPTQDGNNTADPDTANDNHGQPGGGDTGNDNHGHPGGRDTGNDNHGHPGGGGAGAEENPQNPIVQPQLVQAGVMDAHNHQHQNGDHADPQAAGNAQSVPQHQHDTNVNEGEQEGGGGTENPESEGLHDMAERQGQDTNGNAGPPHNADDAAANNLEIRDASAPRVHNYQNNPNNAVVDGSSSSSSSLGMSGSYQLSRLRYPSREQRRIAHEAASPNESSSDSDQTEVIERQFERRYRARQGGRGRGRGRGRTGRANQLGTASEPPAVRRSPRRNGPNVSQGRAGVRAAPCPARRTAISRNAAIPNQISISQRNTRPLGTSAGLPPRPQQPGNAVRAVGQNNAPQLPPGSLQPTNNIVDPDDWANVIPPGYYPMSIILDDAGQRRVDDHVEPSQQQLLDNPDDCPICAFPMVEQTGQSIAHNHFCGHRSHAICYNNYIRIGMRDPSPQRSGVPNELMPRHPCPICRHEDQPFQYLQSAENPADQFILPDGYKILGVHHCKAFGTGHVRYSNYIVDPGLWYKLHRMHMPHILLSRYVLPPSHSGTEPTSEQKLDSMAPPGYSPNRLELIHRKYKRSMDSGNFSCASCFAIKDCQDEAYNRACNRSMCLYIMCKSCCSDHIDAEARSNEDKLQGIADCPGCGTRGEYYTRSGRLRNARRSTRVALQHQNQV